MTNIMAKSEKPNSCPHVTLSAIWKVEADKSYECFRNKQSDEKLIAIRTLSGCGSIEIENEQQFQLCEDTIFIFKYKDVVSYNTYFDKKNFFSW